jgi:RNA polymerase sigma-70 factor (ECF subfamily)
MGAEGTQEDFHELYRHAAWARRLARALVSDGSSADDLVQDAWLASLQHPPQAGRAAKPWLGRVVRNAFRQSARSDTRRANRELVRAAPEPLPGPDALVERLDTQRALAEEIGQLEEPFRTTLLLCFFEDLKPAEIARRQGLPGSTVRWRLMRALEDLRGRLDRRFGTRQHWAGLLLAFARMAPPIPVGSVPASPGGHGAAAAADSPNGALTGTALTVTPGGLFTGAWFMQAGLKIAAVAAVAAVGYFGMSSAGFLPERWSLGPGERAFQVQFRPLPPVDALDPSDDTAQFEEVRGRRAQPPQAVPTPGAPSPEAPRAEFRAAAFDQRGVPLRGATLTVDVHQAVVSEPSGADGVLELELPSGAARAGQSAHARIERPGYVTRTTQALVNLEREVHLGNFQLELGGAISGLVRDAQGQALASIVVCAESARRSRRDLARERYEYVAEALASTRTQPDGTFLLHGVPEGMARVWASGAGWLANFSPPVEVRVGQESMGVELKLEPFPDEVLVCGRVLDAEGQPVPSAFLIYHKQSEGNVTSGTRSADELGRFRFVVTENWKLDLTASDPRGILGSARAEGLVGGMLAVELRLTEPADFELVARDERGQPIDRYQFDVRSSDGVRVLYEVPLEQRPEGRALLGRLADVFLVEVWAPGFSAERTPVLELASLRPDGPPLEVRLRRLPGLSGTIVHRGEPVAGAEVQLITQAADHLHVEVNGFVSRNMVQPGETCFSDEQGRFFLTPREAARYVVRAEKPGFAPAELGPLQVDPAVGAPDLQLELGLGGAIEGQVLIDDAPDAGGKVVGISRADGRARTQRVGSDGKFRFECLTPGPWQVRLCDQELGASVTSSTMLDTRGRPRQIDFDCEVFESQTTVYDLDLRKRSQCRIVGTLQLNGQAAKSWTIGLHSKDNWGRDALAKVGVDLTGRFEIGTSKPGEYWLAGTDAEQDNESQLLLAPIVLGMGVTQRDIELRTGSLVVECPAGGVPAGAQLVHVWEGPNGLMCLTAVTPDANGRCDLTSVPRGKGRIARLDESTLDPLQWPVLAHVEVPANGQGRVVLP